MRLVTAIFLVAVLSVTAAQDPSTDAINDKQNTIETKASVRLDPYIRKALLKALSELEENGDQSTGADYTEGTSTIDSEILKTSDDATEELHTQTTQDGIQIHSFIVNGQSAFSNSTDVTPNYSDRISILSTTAGNVENQVTSVTSNLATQSPFNEIFQTRESGINVQQVRSIQSSNSGENSIKTTQKPIPKTTTSTTTTTTTTTTPKPTHNDDGENIEDVDKRDVQVFQAPLVAAFTVQQDALGLPKKVIPLFQQTSNLQTPLRPHPPQNFPSTVTPVLPIQPIQQNFVTPINKVPQNEFITQQLTLQRQLEEKQRLLEEQLRQLQIQQRQQEELLRKQQFLLQQKEVQRQQQIINEQEQLRRQQFQNNQAINNFQAQSLPKPAQLNSFLSQNNNIRPQNSQVSIQPSVPIASASVITNQQQLPNREAVDFLLHLQNTQPQQFPLQENHLPQGISNFLQPNPVQNQINNFNQFRPIDNQLNQFPQKHGNRVFRQENGVGNFGVNNNQYNRFNTFNPVNHNRFFTQNRQNQFNPADFELKQLLAQSGLNGRGQEDLNIVSKVLSLNHGLPLNNNVSNRLPFDSRRHVRPLL